MKNIKYRHELKHYINLGECAILRSKLSSGVDNREKFRIRL